MEEASPTNHTPFCRTFWMVFARALRLCRVDHYPRGKKNSAGGGKMHECTPRKWRAGWGENTNATPENPSAMAGGPVVEPFRMEGLAAGSILAGFRRFLESGRSRAAVGEFLRRWCWNTKSG